MPKHKKQHYIPRCYLKAWCDPDCPPKHEPYIWHFPANEKVGSKKAPKNIFYETDMYTIWDEKGERQLHIEHSLSSLEGEFTRIRNAKLNFGRPLTVIESVNLVAFLSAMHVRTKSQLAHISKQWERPLKMMDQMAEQMKTATIEQKKRIEAFSSISSSNNRGSLSHEQVRQMVEDPVGTMMIPGLIAEVKLLAKLDMAILTTKSNPGFITSDCPCVWFDPDAYKRPPLFRGPALMYETIEITLPISPTQCILLNRQNLTGYIEVDDSVVDEQNRLLRNHADQYYVVNRNESKDYWHDLGTEPEDSWDNQHSKENANKEIL